MDETDFDALARSLTAGRSRRGLARLLGGVLGAALAPRLGPAETEAKKKGGKKKKGAKCRGKRCKKKPQCERFAGDYPCGTGCCNAFLGEQCCNGACTPADSGCCEGEVTGQCLVCRGGVPRGDDSLCLAFDPDGCSVCEGTDCNPRPNDGTPCRDGAGLSVCGVCVDGLCQDRYTGRVPRQGCAGTCCPAGQSCCNGHCCAPGKPCNGCPPDKQCSDGQCRCNTFAGDVPCGETCCNAFLGETCCAGQCCAEDEECVGGECVPTCPPDTTPCGEDCCPEGFLCCDGIACKPPSDGFGNPPNKCCNDGKGSSCLATQVCCIDSFDNAFCCRSQCGGDFCA